MSYEPEKATFNGKINMMEKYDIYGDVKQTIIYDENFEELITNIKREMKSIPSSQENNKWCSVKLYGTKRNLLDGSSVYEIGYDKVFETDGTDITNMLYDKVLLIMDIPIINYKN